MKEPAIIYTVRRIKPLAELRPSDIPMGMDPDDLATDMAPEEPRAEESATEAQRTSDAPAPVRSSP